MYTVKLKLSGFDRYAIFNHEQIKRKVEYHHGLWNLPTYEKIIKKNSNWKIQLKTALRSNWLIIFTVITAKLYPNRRNK